MDWSNERYVRLYTRDTPEWLCWAWQARALWPLLIRKVDRSGVLANKLGARGVAAMVGLPVQVVEAGLPDLLADGCLQVHQLGYVIPNFIEAQETPQSDKQRKRESRERRRVVTNRDTGSQIVTDCHAESRDVTGGHSEPSLAEPDPEDQKALSPARDPAVPAPEPAPAAKPTPDLGPIASTRAELAAELSARTIPRSTEGSGEPVPPSVETTRPRATQQGAATPGKEATAQGAVPAAGNVAESQLGPGERTAIEHPLPSVVRGDRDANPPPPAIPPGESAWHRRQRWWTAMLEADARIRSAGIEPNAPSLPKAPAGENERNVNHCERQLVESGYTPAEVDERMRHIVAVAEAEAIVKRTRKYFLPALIWDPRRAIRAADTSLANAASDPAQARAGPRSTETGRVEPPPPSAFRRGIVKI